MLTKSLLKGRVIGSVLKPTFISNKNQLGIEAVRHLLNIIKMNQDITLNTFKKIIGDEGLAVNPYTAGLLKVIKDNFTGVDPTNFEKLRWEIIKASQAERVCASSYEAFKENISDRMGMSFDVIQRSIYGDLEEEALLKFAENLGESSLISKYNYNLAQGFLVKAEGLEINIFEHVSQLKPLCARIKFLGLFIESSVIKDNGSLQLIISGPLSITDNVKAYGLKFAAILSMLIDYSKWSLNADVVHNDKKAKFILDDKSPIFVKSQNRRRENYVPDHILNLIGAFNERNKAWQLQPGCEIINLGNEQLCFPDVIAKSSRGDTRYIEFFNKWNKKNLVDRLETLTKNCRNDILVGAERSMLKDKEFSKIIQNTSKFQDVGFTFKDVPSTRALKSLLGN